MKNYFLLVLQTHSVSSNDHQKEQLRYCGASKKEVTKRCVKSLVASIEYAQRLLPQVEFFLKIFDDHSDEETLARLKLIFQQSKVAYDFESIETYGVMPSILKCYEYGRDHGREIVYFVQDDYLYFETAIWEMFSEYYKFAFITKRPISIFPYNDPYRYQPQNLIEKSYIFLGEKRYWRSNFHPSSCFLTHHAVILKEWDLFEAMGRSPVYSGMEQNTIGQIFISRENLLFTPIPSLALHMQLETERDPFLDWRTLWDQFADVEPAPLSSNLSQRVDGQEMRIKVDRPKNKKIVANIGCGRNTIPVEGFQKDPWMELRVDLDEKSNPHVLASITSMTQIEDKSVDAIWASHILEHIHWHEIPQAMNEIKRILKNDGCAVIAVPDMKVAAQTLLNKGPLGAVYESAAGPIAALDMMYGFRPYIASGLSGMSHKIGFTAELLHQIFVQFEFADIRIKERDAEILTLVSLTQVPDEVLNYINF